MGYLRFYPILLLIFAAVALSACDSSTKPSAEAMATLCYYFEMQSNTTKAVAEDLLGREITNAETDELARPHEIAYMEKYPRPASVQQMQLDLFTYCDFNALTDEQQALILQATREIAGIEDGSMAGSR